VRGGGTSAAKKATLSPFLTCVTPFPTSSTIPDPSFPGINGVLGQGYNPCRKYLEPPSRTKFGIWGGVHVDKVDATVGIFDENVSFCYGGCWNVDEFEDFGAAWFGVLDCFHFGVGEGPADGGVGELRRP